MTNNVRKIIEENGLKITYVIDKAGISKSHFYDIMNGDSIPSITNAYKIADVLKKKIEEVFPDRSEHNE